MRSELCSVDFNIRLSDHCFGEWRVKTQERKSMERGRKERQRSSDWMLLICIGELVYWWVFVSAKLKCQVAGCVLSLSLLLSVCVLSSLGRLRRFSTLAGFTGRQAIQTLIPFHFIRSSASVNIPLIVFFFCRFLSYEGFVLARFGSARLYTQTNSWPFITFEIRHYKTQNGSRAKRRRYYYPPSGDDIDTNTNTNNIVKQARVFVVVAAPRTYTHTSAYVHTHTQMDWHSRILRTSHIGSIQLFRPTPPSQPQSAALTAQFGFRDRALVLVRCSCPTTRRWRQRSNSGSSNSNKH